jgi:Raf kinase inhibitor-like YbhB/YbcL family protein
VAGPPERRAAGGALAAGLLLLLAGCGAGPAATPSPSPAAATAAPAGSAFTLTSADLREGGTIPLVHVYNSSGCTGQNLSPALSWAGAPPGTRSFAVSVFDPDAPSGGFWHWAMYDIPPTATALARGAGTPGAGTPPAGAHQARNGFGAAGYGGPCPPRGNPPHHYIVTVTAVDVPGLGLGDGAPAAQAGFAARAHSLASARLTALYGR